MATGSWNSPRLPSCRTWLNSGLDCVRRITNLTSAHRANLVRRGILLGLGVVFLAIASLLWHTVLMMGIAVFLAEVLQELADPSPLFWAAPWELLGIVFSRNVRLNHFWFHRTQDLIREASGCLGKLEGFATQDVFVLMGAGFNEVEVRWASELAWRMMCGQGASKESIRGCKTTRILLAVLLIAGGLVAVIVWQGKIELASAVLVAGVCAAAGHGLAGPTERFLSPWAALIAFCDDGVCSSHLEVGSFSSRHFIWYKGGQTFRVWRVEDEENPAGERT